MDNLELIKLEIARHNRELDAIRDGSKAKEWGWAEKIGKPAAESLREMVTALECDYERLEELRDERKDITDGENNDDLDAWDAENGEELKELSEAAGDCADHEDALTRIQEDALSVMVRSDWEDRAADFSPSEFEILLTTGGPAVRIRGELRDGEPHRAWLEVQDWNKPWTHYFEDGLSDILLTYARCFCFE